MSQCIVIGVVVIIAVVLVILIVRMQKGSFKCMPELVSMYKMPEIQGTNPNTEFNHIMKELSTMSASSRGVFDLKAQIEANAMKMFNSNSLLLGAAKLQPLGYKTVIPPGIQEYPAKDRIPLVFIPGLCASQIYCGWHFNDSPFLCTNNSDGETLWISPMMLLPEALGGDCWKRRCMAYWRKDSFGIETYNNIEGMYSEPSYFGTLRGLDYLSDEIILDSLITYFKTTSDVLRANGYRDGVDLFGAPYDFRLILNKDVLSKWMKNFQNLIETAYTTNGFKKVALMGHSCGCVLTHAFLVGMSKEWKDKHIAKFISVAGPYGGASKAFRTMMSGDNLGIPGKQSTFRDIGRTLSCITWMLPKEDLFGNLNILTLQGKSYRPREYPTIFNMIGRTQQYLQSIPYREIMNKSNECKNELVLPFYQPTEIQYVYQNSIEEDPTIINENAYYMELAKEGRWPSGVFSPDKAVGDGTVPFLSLYLPTMRWTDGSITRQFNVNADHVGVLSNPEFLNFLVGTLHRP